MDSVKWICQNCGSRLGYRPNSCPHCKAVTPFAYARACLGLALAIVAIVIGVRLGAGSKVAYSGRPQSPQVERKDPYLDSSATIMKISGVPSSQFICDDNGCRYIQ